MRSKRRNHSPGFKARIALAAIKGDKTIAELSQQFGVHPNQVGIWRKQLVENAQGVFGRGSGKEALGEKRIKELHAKTGQLTLENDFLSKVLGR